MMKKFKSEELIADLQHDIKQLILAAEYLQTSDPVKLGYSPEEGKWSVAQVIEHMNMYARHYLPLIDKSLIQLPKHNNPWFVPGFWGNYFTKMIMPSNVFEVKNRMKTMKAFRPDKSVNVAQAFQEFIKHQNKLLQLLEISKRRNLNTIHITTAVSSFVKFKLGDMYRFLIAHEQRHMLQARNTVKAVGIATDKFPVILEAAKL